MRLFFYLSLLSFASSAFCFSPLEKHRFYLKQEENKKEFQTAQRQNLKNRLKELQKERGREKFIQKKNQLLEKQHERQKKEFDQRRKKAFLEYKKQYTKYQKRKKNILEKRLKELRKIRKDQKTLPPERPLFSL